MQSSRQAETDRWQADSSELPQRAMAVSRSYLRLLGLCLGATSDYWGRFSEPEPAVAVIQGTSWAAVIVACPWSLLRDWHTIAGPGHY